MVTGERAERWRAGRAGRSREMEEGMRRGTSTNSSFRASVTGLVRRVSQKVTRENKDSIRRRGSRRSRSGNGKKSFKRNRSIKRPPNSCERDRGYPTVLSNQSSVAASNSILQRLNLFFTTSFNNFLLMIGYQPPLRDVMVTEIPQAALVTVAQEEVELVPKRYRPDNINNLCTATGFSKAQMKRLYRIFKSECPSGLITEEVFHNIFSKFFPLDAENYNANVSSYSHYIFSAIAQEDAEVITFEDFVLGLSILVNGSDDEKLEWTFHLYDLDGDGVISREEMEDLAMAIYELMGDSKEISKSLIEEGDIYHKVDMAFKKFDLDGNGVVDLEEFLTVCREDSDIQMSLLNVNDIRI